LLLDKPDHVCHGGSFAVEQVPADDLHGRDNSQPGAPVDASERRVA
jgi:hypothetical protein